MEIRKFEPRDTEEASNVIALSLRRTNYRDYSEDVLETVADEHRPDRLLEKIKGRNYYVAFDGGHVVGIGGIGSYWGKTDESCLFTIFVHPDHQRKGVGRKIVEALEKDELFLRAKRVWVHAAITAVPFYLKLGYVYHNGVRELDEDRLILMEKSR